MASAPAAAPAPPSPTDIIKSRGHVALLVFGAIVGVPVAVIASYFSRLVWGGTETSLFWCGYLDGAVRAGHQPALTALGAHAGERSAAREG